MILRLYYLCILFLCTHVVYSQSIISISDVCIEGLKRTKESYIEQFLVVKKGDFIDSLAIDNDVQTLKNLQLFSSVEATFKDTLGKVQLVYTVKEVITRLPLVGLGWTDSVFWTELGGMDLNFLGKGIQCAVKYRYYQRNSYIFFLKNQHYKGSKWGYEVLLNRLATVEPLYFTNSTQLYNYDNNSVGFGIMYWLFKRNSISAYSQYIYEDYSKTINSREFSKEGPLEHRTNKLLLKLSNQTNLIDYNGVRLKGVSNYFALETIQSRNAYERFVKLSNELKLFKFIGNKANFAFRLRAGISTNNDTPFASFVADNYINLRGVGDRTIRGTAEIATNLEYRHSIFSHPSINIATVGFVDAGSWRLPGSDVSTIFDGGNISLYSGAGIRLHFLMLYNAILRVDYSINVKDISHHGVILGVGQYF